MQGFNPLGQMINGVMASFNMRCASLAPISQKLFGIYFFSNLASRHILGHCHYGWEIYSWLDCFKDTTGPL